MKITLHPPLGFSIQGERDYNEDSLYPNLDAVEANPFRKLFLVCDGVGGASRGEVASQLACESFAHLLEPELKEDNPVIDETLLADLLKATEERLSDYLEANLEARGMATTVTLLALHSGGVTVGHIGDSRVYQFREGSIIFQTKDHSFVQELLDEGLIDEERAKVHPKRNVISRALQGQEKPTKIATTVLTDIREGDYFLLCSDGVLEAWFNSSLSALFDEEDQEQLVQTLLKGCQERSKDNATAYVLRVKKVQGHPADWAVAASEQEAEIPVLEDEDTSDDLFSETDAEITTSTGSSTKAMGLPILLLLGAILIAALWWQPWQSTEQPEESLTTSSAVERGAAETVAQKDQGNAKWAFWDGPSGIWRFSPQFDTMLQDFKGPYSKAQLGPLYQKSLLNKEATSSNN